ncbi:MAG: selenide, water dikinase SelD, partial [Anaerolineae bacterium]
PVKTLPMSLLGEILRGGADKLAEAGASLVGGHSIDDHEPKYGLAVTGLVHPDRVVTKAGARPGDALVLTKPLGIGIITTGIDRQWVNEETAQRAVDVMLRLNRDAADAMLQVSVHACTDVTGFGLLGHLHEMLVSSSRRRTEMLVSSNRRRIEMLDASGVGARIWLDRVPVLEEAWDLAARDCVPDGSHNNHRYLAEFVRCDPAVSRAQQLVLCDAQTSGGLLMAVPSERAEVLLAALVAARTPAAAMIGEIVEGPAGRIEVARS